MLRILTNAVGARKNAALNRRASRLSGRTSGLKLRQLLAKVYRWSVPCVLQTSSKRSTPRRKKRANADGLGWRNIIPSWISFVMVR